MSDTWRNNQKIVIVVLTIEEFGMYQMIIMTVSDDNHDRTELVFSYIRMQYK